MDLTHINESQTTLEVKQLYQNYDPERRQTKNSIIRAKILLKDQEPVYQRPRRIAEEERQVFFKRQRENRIRKQIADNTNLRKEIALQEKIKHEDTYIRTQQNEEEVVTGLYR
ncbi:hypothetical protein QE152_g35017 [Popillia japonica]|uniref:Uncharacterized protein n=1 Tax=Popillia japonica TaxID=7064 RepID=A0AAW1ISB1_POPJA